MRKNKLDNLITDRLSDYDRQKLFLQVEQNSVTYGQLNDEVVKWKNTLNANDVKYSDFILILGDYSLEAISASLAVMDYGASFTLQTYSSYKMIEHHLDSLGVDWVIQDGALKSRKRQCENAIFNKNPGVCLFFSSGTTGNPKAIVHDYQKLIEKFNRNTESYISIAFLTFDHMGGFNTLISAIFSESTLIYTADRTPGDICKKISIFKVTVFSTTPTFLNMLLASSLYKNYDLRSLVMITYGTEVMNQATLKRLTEIFPTVRFKQTYGLSEIGVLPTKSKSKTSLFFKISASDIKVKVVNGILHIKCPTEMLGNFIFKTAKNWEFKIQNLEWFCTDDFVEVDGDYFRILGRKTDLINVGGSKIYPVEVEEILTNFNYIASALVYKAEHKLLGNVVAAKIILDEDFVDSFKSSLILKLRIMKDCRGKLPKYAVPSEVHLVEDFNVTTRFKTKR